MCAKPARKGQFPPNPGQWSIWPPSAALASGPLSASWRPATARQRSVASGLRVSVSLW